MAHYNVFVQDSSPLFIYSPPGAWIDTPLESNGSPSTSYHATDFQGATVKLGFVGTGVHVFSASAPTPGSYEVYVDGKKFSESGDPSSTPASQLLLGSITGLEMGPHTVTLVNSGVTGDVLDLDRVEVESVVNTGSSSWSTATFDDTNDEIQWGHGWVSAQGQSAFYNGTIHYTEQPDAEMRFSFEGDAIAVYGTAGAEMGKYLVTLDGQSQTFNGGSDGSARTPHDQTIFYLANGLSAGRHDLTITANPSSMGKSQVFNVDSIKVLSGSSSSGPVLLPPDSINTGVSSSLPPPVSTGSTYTSVISSTVFPKSTPLPTPISSSLSPSLMPFSSSTSPTLLPTTSFDGSQSNRVLQAASDNPTVVTDRGLIASAILAAIIACVGLAFLALFMWKRRTLDPPPYIDVEKANQPDEKSPGLPIQLADKISSSPKEIDSHFPMRGHSRSGSNASSMTANDYAYDSYRKTLQKRKMSTDSILSTDSTYRDSVSDYSSEDIGYTGRKGRGKSEYSVSSVYSDASQYSQKSERIIIKSVRMPPQFAMPAPPPSVVLPLRLNRMSPPRPARVRDSLALPF